MASSTLKQWLEDLCTMPESLLNKTFLISTGVSDEGEMKWISEMDGGQYSEVTDPETAQSFNYGEARAICSKDENGWIAFPLDYLMTRAETVIKRRKVMMHRGRGWREYGLKGAVALNLKKEMKQ